MSRWQEGGGGGLSRREASCSRAGIEWGEGMPEGQGIPFLGWR